MTTIDKLVLKGIRSYGSDDNTHIEFIQPLTIILGSNGSGKSTILEGIVKVITGQVPPLGSNTSFIRDPNIDSRTGTEARISLNFTTAQGQNYTATREFSSCIKENSDSSKLEFKSKSSVLGQYTIRARNLRIPSKRSFKSTELNDVVLDLMQTRRSVLNNVLFVHQEDALWPLADPTLLKRKFDNLFETTQYNGIIDCFHEQNKKLVKDLDDVRKNLLIHQEKVKTLEKQQSEVEDRRKNVEEEDEKIDTYESHRTSLDSDLRKASEAKEKDIEKKGLEKQRSSIRKSKETKRRDVGNFLKDKTIKDLTKEITCEKATREEEEERCRKADSGMKELDQSIASVKENQTINMTTLGIMEEQAKKQKERLDFLKAKKKEFDEACIFSNPLTNDGDPIPEPRSSDDLDGWTSSLESLRRDAEANVQKVTEESSIAFDKANAALTGVKLKLKAVETEMKSKIEELKKEQAELITTQDDLWSLLVSQPSGIGVQEKIAAIEEGLQGENIDNRINSLKDEIDRDQGRILLLEKDLSSARSNRNQLWLDQFNQAKMQANREMAKSKEEDMHTLFEEFGSHLVSCIDLLEKWDEGRDLSILKDEIIHMSGDKDVKEKQTKFNDASKRVLAKRNELIKAAQKAVDNSLTDVNYLSIKRDEFKKDVDEAKRDLSGIDNDLRQLKHDLMFSDEELNEASASARSDAQIPRVTVEGIIKLFSGVSVSPDAGGEQLQDVHINGVSSCVKEFNEALTSVDYSIRKLETGKTLAESDLHEFDTHPEHMCPACGMISSNTGEMRKNLEDRANRYDGRVLAAARRSKDAFSAAVSVVQRLQNQCNQATISIKTFTSATDRLREVEEKEQEANRVYEENRKALDDLLCDIGDDSVVSIVGQVEQKRLELNQSITDYDKAAREMRQLQASLPSSNSETLSPTETEEKVRDIEEEKRTLQNKVNTDRQKKEELTWFKTYKGLEWKEAKCTQSINGAKGAINEFKIQIQNLKEDQARKTSEIDDLRKKNEDRINKVTLKRNGRVKLVDGLNGIISNVKEYETNEKEKFEAQTKLVKRMEENLEKMKQQRAEYVKDREAAEESRKEAEKTIISLEENLAYRQEEEREREVEDEIKKLEKEIVERIGDGIDPVENFKTKYSEFKEVDACLNFARGRRVKCYEEYNNKKLELDKTGGEGIREEYNKLQRQETILEQARRELPIIPLAIEQAIEEFHTLKMQTINQTIRELWQRIYQGNDIDDIEIVYELQKPDSGSSSRRTFEYRVVMKKGATKLNMRGRCSSGQKVLACLVIRLALVETFCRECRILALDEPTTNLDRSNIASIAHAIRTIIEEDQYQKKFQLILITHDEEFIEMIGARDFVSKYYKVERDEQKKSCVTARPLMEVEA